MKLEQIEVIIEANGKVRLETSGFSGDECLAATREVEALLGDQVLQRERTAESFDKSTVRTAADKLKIREI